MYLGIYIVTVENADQDIFQVTKSIWVTQDFSSEIVTTMLKTILKIPVVNAYN